MTENKEIESLFRLYYRPLCLYAFKYLKDTETVEDIVQDAYVKCLEKRGTSDWPKSPKQYLFRIVHNHCLDIAKAGSSLSHSEASSISDGPPDEESVDRSFLLSQLWTEVDKMPEKRRRAFLMSKRDGLSYARIGELLGVSENTVHNHITKALKSLREGLKTIILLSIIIAINYVNR